MLVFVAAERRELEGLLAHIEEVSARRWEVDFACLGRLNGRRVALVANGPGPELAAGAVDAVKRHEGVGSLVSIGFCGGLRPSLGVCDIFVPTEIAGVAQVLSPSSSRPFKTGTLLSMDRVISSAAEKAELAGKGDAVEMEAAGVAERAKRYNAPFYAVRVITDTAGESFSLDFNRLRSAGGRFSRTKIVAAALRKPAAIPDLIQLNKRTKRASRALGDFLADARF